MGGHRRSDFGGAELRGRVWLGGVHYGTRWGGSYLRPLFIVEGLDKESVRRYATQCVA